MTTKLDKLLDDIERVYHTPLVGMVRMEVADLRRECDSWQALAAAADADKRKAEQERDAARAEVEALRKTLRWLKNWIGGKPMPHIVHRIDAALAGERREGEG